MFFSLYLPFDLLRCHCVGEQKKKKSIIEIVQKAVLFTFRRQH